MGDLLDTADAVAALRGMADILEAADGLDGRIMAPSVTLIAGYGPDALALLVQAIDADDVEVNGGSAYVIRHVGAGRINIYTQPDKVGRKVERTVEVFEPLPVAELAKLTQTPAEAMREHGIATDG